MEGQAIWPIHRREPLVRRVYQRMDNLIVQRVRTGMLLPAIVETRILLSKDKINAMMSNPVHSCDSSQLPFAAQGTSTLISSVGRLNDQVIIDELRTEIAALKEQHKIAMEEKHTKFIRAQDDMVAKSKSFSPTTSFHSFSYIETCSLFDPNL